MSEILVNTIKKADGTGSLTVPSETGTVLTSASGASLSGADFTDQVTVTKTSAGASTNALVVRNLDNTAGTAASIGFAAHGSGVETHRIEAEVDGPNSYSMRFYTYQGGLNERMRIDPTYIYFGTTTSNPTSITNGGGMAYHVPSGLKIAAAQDTCLRLNRTENSSGNIASFFFDATEVGRITVNGSSTSYVTSSDYRLKENVVDMTDAITRVKQLSPKRFNFIVDADDTTVDGFLAHEAQTVVPEAVEGTHNEVDVDGNPVMQGIDQSKLVPLLTAALQEAIAKIETLETTVADLQTRVTALEGA